MVNVDIHIYLYIPNTYIVNAVCGQFCIICGFVINLMHISSYA